MGAAGREDRRQLALEPGMQHGIGGALDRLGADLAGGRSA